MSALAPAPMVSLAEIKAAGLYIPPGLTPEQAVAWWNGEEITPTPEQAAAARPSVPAMDAVDLTYYLGTHEISWLWRPEIQAAHARLFISYRRFMRRKSRPRRPLVRWALDSGGFSELAAHGRWTVTPEEYVEFVVDLCDAGLDPDWAAPQDWMCESEMLARTGRTLEEHQHLTVENFCRLWQLWPHDEHSFPFMPVLQGWTLADYLHCRDLYAKYGVRLSRFPLVGVGSICSRQGTDEAVDILRELANGGLALHAFGFKLDGLRRAAKFVASTDSMAWSDDARKAAARTRPTAVRTMPGCTHASCANCHRWATAWLHRARASVGIDQPDWTPWTDEERAARSDELWEQMMGALDRHEGREAA